MAKEGQIPNNLLFDSGNFWQQERSSGPFGSLIELAFKLKNVQLRLLQKFRDKRESRTGSNCMMFQNSIGLCPKYKDWQHGKSCQEDILSKSYKTFQNSSDSFAVNSSRNTSSDFKLPLLPASSKSLKSGVRYENGTAKRKLPIQRKTKSFHSAPHRASTVDPLRYSCGNLTTRKSRRLQRYYEVLKRKHNCPLCLYQTDNRCHLRHHQSSAHDANKEYFCYVCKKEFSRSERVKAHFLNMHPETTYQPKKARKEACTSDDDYNDSDMKTDELMDSYTAAPAQLVVSEAVQSTIDTNDSPAKKSWERYCHVISQPLLNQQIFCCQVCSFSGSDIWVMKKHYLDVHLGATTYICRICRYSSSCVTRLVSHMLGHGELICFRCSYSTTDVKFFEKHLTDCSLLFHCSTCGLSFVDKDQLQSHTIEVHQSVLFCCDQCGFSSSSYAELSLHENQHIVSNDCLVQEIESEDEMLLGPYRSKVDVSNASFPKRLLKQRMQSSTLATCDDAVIISNDRDDISDNTLNPSSDASGSKDNLVTTSTIHLSSHLYECLVPNCGFKSCWKKSLELHTENYHSLSSDNFMDDRSPASSGWPQSIDCPASGFFPCPFCPNYRTFKYRKSFEKHLGQHGLDHKKYPYLLAGLNVKGEVLNNSVAGIQ